MFRSISRIARVLLLCAVAAVIWAAPGEAHAVTYNYQVCVKWRIDTVDSSMPISGGPDNGLIEDQYQGCNSTCDVVARGVSLMVDRGAWSQLLQTDPTTGCATFSYTNPAAHVYDITVYGYHTNSANDFVRIHDDPDEIYDGGSYYPGSEISYFINDQSLTPGGGANTVYAGDYSEAEWTGVAAAAFSLYRLPWPSSNTNFQYHIGIDDTSCGAATAHFNTTGYGGAESESNSKITDGKHYLLLGACGNGTPHARRKFLVGHEVGHALLAMHYGRDGSASDGDEPDVDYSSSTSTSGNFCYDPTPTYGINTNEWDSTAYREGFAHFVSARVWNDKDPSGLFRWINLNGAGGSHDLAARGKRLAATTPSGNHACGAEGVLSRTLASARGQA